MIDTIKCQSELDLTEEFYQKLLLGAIDKNFDHEKMEAHNPAEEDPEDAPALPYRSRMAGKGKERRWSDDETIAVSSNRQSSVNRSSTMQTLYESPIGDAGPKSAFGERPSNTTTFRHASPPSTGYGQPTRRTTFHHSIQETEEPEPRAGQRSFTFGSHR